MEELKAQEAALVAGGATTSTAVSPKPGRIVGRTIGDLKRDDERTTPKQDGKPWFDLIPINTPGR